MFTKIIIATLGAASVASALVPRGVCNADNCLRALRATSPKTRLEQAQSDCAAWLTVTSTPVETATAYTTVSDLTSTLVEELTTTSTVCETSTSTVYETPTETTYTATVTVTVDPVVILTKRAAPTIPAYASPCSGAVRYSSACSCIGVSGAVTVTAPTSTTTVTVPTTGLTTVQETSVVATSVTIVYDSTVTVTVTQPAVTVSTATTTTETKAAQPTARVGQVAITVPGRAPGYMGAVASNTLSLAAYTDQASQAITLTLRPDGSLWYGNKVAKSHENGLTLQLFFIAPDVATSRLAVTCVTDSEGFLTCQTRNNGNNKFGIVTSQQAPAQIYLGKAQGLPTPSYTIITLKLI